MNGYIFAFIMYHIFCMLVLMVGGAYIPQTRKGITTEGILILLFAWAVLPVILIANIINKD